MFSRFLRQGGRFLISVVVAVVIPLVVVTGHAAPLGTDFLLYRAWRQAGNRAAAPFPAPERFLLRAREEWYTQDHEGMRVILRRGETALVEMPDSLVETLCAQPLVQSLNPVHALLPTLDQSGPAMDLPLVQTWQGNTVSGFTGSGVVLGLVDSGVDPYHPDFYAADGVHTRLWRIRDLAEERVWDAAAVENHTCGVTDLLGHGTHVLSIMGGNGAAGEAVRYAGVAPEATLVVVKTANFGEDQILEGVGWILEQARQLEAPCVVNLSLESRWGPHDGSSSFERLLSSLTGPGALVTVAVGNGGEYRIHEQRLVAPGGTVEAVLNTGTEEGEYVLADFWTEAGRRPDFRALAPDGREFAPAAAGNQPVNLGSLGTLYFYQAAGADPENGKYNCTFYLQPGAAHPQQQWRIRVTNGGTTAAQLDGWSYNAEFQDGGATFLGAVSSPATADSVVAVGALVSRVTWPSLVGGRRYAQAPEVGEMAWFSNRGPRLDGRPIPVTAAPGMGIMAALSSQMNTSGLEDWIAPDGRHILRQGTSMAAPQVAGALALALQKDPFLSCVRVDSLLRAAAVPLAGQEGWDPQAGAGLLNIARLLDLVTGALLDFSVSAGYFTVDLRWEVGEDPETQTFVLLRNGSGADTTITVEAVPGQRIYAYRDETVLPGQTYEYQLLARSGEGEIRWRSDPLTVATELLHTALAFGRIHPNPFHDVLDFRVATRESLPGARTCLYTVTGRRVRCWATPLAAGETRFSLSVPGLAAGTYLVRTGDGGRHTVAKVIHLP